MTLTVVLSAIGLPFALAVTSEQVRADTAPAAAAVAAAVMAGVAVTAAAMCGVTRVVCDRIRTARWEHGLDSLEDAVWPRWGHGRGDSRPRGDIRQFRLPAR